MSKQNQKQNLAPGPTWDPKTGAKPKYIERQQYLLNIVCALAANPNVYPDRHHDGLVTSAELILEAIEAKVAKW